MKSQIYTAFILLFVLSSQELFAQRVIPQPNCINHFYRPEIDSLKRVLGAQHFMLVREASMTMESGYEMPVVMSLAKGNTYQLIFIGDPRSAQFEVRMFDWKERQVFYKKNQISDWDRNIINYSYLPLVTENHLMKPVQVCNSQKNGLCGYVMVFKKLS